MCLWDLMRSIPSLESRAPRSLKTFTGSTRTTPTTPCAGPFIKRGKPFPTDGKMLLTPKAQGELMKLFFTHRRELFDKRFDDFVGEEFFQSNFWVYWLSMFAIGPWHGALEMKLYMHRFIQHFGGMADLSAIKFTRLNQYDSLMLPLVKWLEQQGVTIVYDTKVTNVVFDITPERKSLAGSSGSRAGSRRRDVTANDFVLITNRLAVENTDGGTTRPRPSGTGKSRRAALGDVAQHRRPGPRLRPSRQVLRPHRRPTRVGMHQDPRRQDPRIHRADLQARTSSSAGSSSPAAW